MKPNLRLNNNLFNGQKLSTRPKVKPPLSSKHKKSYSVKKRSDIDINSPKAINYSKGK